MGHHLGLQQYPGLPTPIRRTATRSAPCPVADFTSISMSTRLCMVSVKLPAHDAHGGGQSQGGSRHGGEGPCHEARVLYLHVLTSISSPGMVRTWSWPPCLPCPRRKTAIRPTPWQRVWRCLMCRKPVFQMPYQGCTYVHTRHDRSPWHCSQVAKIGSRSSTRNEQCRRCGQAVCARTTTNHHHELPGLPNGAACVRHVHSRGTNEQQPMQALTLVLGSQHPRRSGWTSRKVAGRVEHHTRR